MNQQSYVKLEALCKKHRKFEQTVSILNRYITLFVYLTYPVFLVVSFVNFGVSPTWVYAVIPFAVLVAVSVFRNVYNAPRPYEKFDFTPICRKDTKGKSFPSRHVTSAFIISFMIFDFNIYIGIFYLAISLVLAIARVLSGVHFIKDVVAGALFSTLVYIAFCFIQMYS